MDTDSLVDNLIDDGRKLVERLPQNGFEVTAAFWLRASEDGQWRFYIVSPLVVGAGLAQAYGRWHSLMRQMPEPLAVDPLKVRLIGPNDPLAGDVLAIYRCASGPRQRLLRLGGISLGNESVEEAYLYPLPAGGAG